MIGYGFLVSEFLRMNSLKFGISGILGITFVALISFSSSLFLNHGVYFNLSVLLIGFFWFIIRFKKVEHFYKELIVHFFVFLFLCFFILVAKNHDDFPYYHFPYISILTEFSHPFGLGQLNNGFRSPSSVFFISSMFYLPKIDIYLFHIFPALIMGFANLIFLEKIFNKDVFLKKNIINFLCLSSLIFINIFFYRLAEHGTDRSGMILIILSTIFLISLINNQQNNLYLDEMKFLIICICFVCTIKPFYLINFLFFIIFLIHPILRTSFLKLFFSRSFYYCLSLLFFIIFYTFINSGCLIFPMTITCFENLPWSLNKSYINEVKIWFELWSKAGATPNYVVSEGFEYISGLSWVQNWIDNYFFNKVSDFLIGIIFLCLILFLFFYSKNIKYKIPLKKYFSIFIVLAILLLEWFFYHPALRYGGYHLIFLITAIPLCFILSSIRIDYDFYYKKALFLALITLVIFSFRNYQRLEKEFERYNFNPIINSNYKFTEPEEFYYRHNKQVKDNLIKNNYFRLVGKNFIIISKD